MSERSRMHTDLNIYTEAERNWESEGTKHGEYLSIL